MVDTRQRVLPLLNSVTHLALVEAVMEAWNIPTNFFFEACSYNILYTRQTVFFVDANTIVFGMSPGDFNNRRLDHRDLSALLSGKWANVTKYLCQVIWSH